MGISMGKWPDFEYHVGKWLKYDRFGSNSSQPTLGSPLNLGDPWRPCLKMVILAILTISRHGRQGSFGLVEEQKEAVSNAGETCQEVPVCSGHKHPGRACVQLDGFPVEQEEAQPVWWKRHHAALPEGQPGALSRCLFYSKMRWQ